MHPPDKMVDEDNPTHSSATMARSPTGGLSADELQSSLEGLQQQQRRRSLAQRSNITETNDSSAALAGPSSSATSQVPAESTDAPPPTAPDPDRIFSSGDGDDGGNHSNDWRETHAAATEGFDPYRPDPIATSQDFDADDALGYYHSSSYVRPQPIYGSAIYDQLASGLRTPKGMRTPSGAYTPRSGISRSSSANRLMDLQPHTHIHFYPHYYYVNDSGPDNHSGLSGMYNPQQDFGYGFYSDEDYQNHNGSDSDGSEYSYDEEETYDDEDGYDDDDYTYEDEYDSYDEDNDNQSNNRRSILKRVGSGSGHAEEEIHGSGSLADDCDRAAVSKANGPCGSAPVSAAPCSSERTVYGATGAPALQKSVDDFHIPPPGGGGGGSTSDADDDQKGDEPDVEGDITVHAADIRKRSGADDTVSGGLAGGSRVQGFSRRRSRSLEPSGRFQRPAHRRRRRRRRRHGHRRRNGPPFLAAVGSGPLYGDNAGSDGSGGPAGGIGSGLAGFVTASANALLPDVITTRMAQGLSFYDGTGPRGSHYHQRGRRSGSTSRIPRDNSGGQGGAGISLSRFLGFGRAWVQDHSVLSGAGAMVGPSAVASKWAYGAYSGGYGGPRHRSSRHSSATPSRRHRDGSVRASGTSTPTFGQPTYIRGVLPRSLPMKGLPGGDFVKGLSRIIAMSLPSPLTRETAITAMFLNCLLSGSGTALAAVLLCAGHEGEIYDSRRPSSSPSNGMTPGTGYYSGGSDYGSGSGGPSAKFPRSAVPAGTGAIAAVAAQLGLALRSALLFIGVDVNAGATPVAAPPPPPSQPQVPWTGSTAEDPPSSGGRTFRSVGCAGAGADSGPRMGTVGPVGGDGSSSDFNSDKPGSVVGASAAFITDPALPKVRYRAPQSQQSQTQQRYQQPQRHPMAKRSHKTFPQRCLQLAVALWTAQCQFVLAFVIFGYVWSVLWGILMLAHSLPPVAAVALAQAATGSGTTSSAGKRRHSGMTLAIGGGGQSVALAAAAAAGTAATTRQSPTGMHQSLTLNSPGSQPSSTEPPANAGTLSPRPSPPGAPPVKRMAGTDVINRETEVVDLVLDTEQLR
eukprot:Clim_evm4s85 gene=Clim_evmTU4s85